jgi:hypothetical protein
MVSGIMRMATTTFSMTETERAKQTVGNPSLHVVSKPELTASDRVGDGTR